MFTAAVKLQTFLSFSNFLLVLTFNGTEMSNIPKC
jgi:hypothetical protein